MTALDLHLCPIQKPSTGYRFDLCEMKKAARQESSWLYLCTIINLLLGALGLAGVLLAQESPSIDTAQDSGLILQQTVRRVRVDVVVTDAQGHPVAGLLAPDFHVAGKWKTANDSPVRMA